MNPAIFSPYAKLMGISKFQKNNRTQLSISILVLFDNSFITKDSIDEKFFTDVYYNKK